MSHGSALNIMAANSMKHLQQSLRLELSATIALSAVFRCTKEGFMLLLNEFTVPASFFGFHRLIVPIGGRFVNHQVVLRYGYY